MDWSTRLIRTLDYVKTKYVIMFLEDEFIQEPVDTKKLNRDFNLLKKDPFISYILFTTLFHKGTNEVTSLRYRRYDVIKRIRVTQSSANGGFWKLKKLKQYLKAGESPWEFETNCKQRRSFFDRCYAIKDGESPIITTFNIRNGYGIVKGKWLWKNEELFSKFGIQVDFSKRGIISKAEVEEYLEEYWKKRKAREKEEREMPFFKRVRARLELYLDAMPEKQRKMLSRIKKLFGGK